MTIRNSLKLSCYIAISGNDYLPFAFQSDADLVVLVREGGVKETVPLAQAMFEVMVGKNIPDVGLKLHDVKPLTVNEEALP